MKYRVGCEIFPTNPPTEAGRYWIMFDQEIVGFLNNREITYKVVDFLNGGRSYTLADLDKMREFFVKRKMDELWEGRDGVLTSEENKAKAAAEEQLRTALMAGVDPREFK